MFASLFPGAAELAETFSYFEAHTYLGTDSTDRIALANKLAGRQPSTFSTWARENVPVQAPEATCRRSPVAAPATSQLGEPTFSPRGPLGPWPRSNVTAWPSRSSSNEVWPHADCGRSLVAVAREDEAEALVADETLDRAVHSCHLSDS